MKEAINSIADSSESVKQTQAWTNDHREWYRTVYLQSDHWHHLKTRKLQANPACERCGSSSNLDVHHLNYRNIIDVELSDLESLCRPCHSKEHEENGMPVRARAHLDCLTFDEWMELRKYQRKPEVDTTAVPIIKGRSMKKMVALALAKYACFHCRNLVVEEDCHIDRMYACESSNLKNLVIRCPECHEKFSGTDPSKDDGARFTEIYNQPVEYINSLFSTATAVARNSKIADSKFRAIPEPFSAPDPQ